MLAWEHNVCGHFQFSHKIRLRKVKSKEIRLFSEEHQRPNESASVSVAKRRWPLSDRHRPCYRGNVQRRPLLHNGRVLNQALDGEGTYKEAHYPPRRVAEAFWIKTLTCYFCQAFLKTSPSLFYYSHQVLNQALAVVCRATEKNLFQPSAGWQANRQRLKVPYMPQYVLVATSAELEVWMPVVVLWGWHSGEPYTVLDLFLCIFQTLPIPRMRH